MNGANLLHRYWPKAANANANANDPPLPVLYSFRRCPYAMRARLAIAASGIPVEHREVVLRNKPEALLAASPKGTVPVLVLATGQVIDESLDIMRWALGQHDPGGWLTPAGAAPDAMSAMRELIAFNDGPFKQHLDRYKYPNRYPDEIGIGQTGEAQDARAWQTEFALTHRAAAADWVHALDSRLAQSPGHHGLLGPTLSLADMALLPFVRQFAHTDAPWFVAQPWPHARQWLTNFEASVLFHTIMARHAPWQSAAA